MRAPSTLITGGAGFIGANLADALLLSGKPVTIYDNFSRPNVERNAEWLQRKHGSKLRIHWGDVRDRDGLEEAVRGADQIYHFAAQVAVTTSIEDPLADFEINAGGTMNLLYAIRRQPHPVPVVFTSTNKVYGGLSDVELSETALRYEPADPVTRMSGIGESRALDFHTPYGCSKGTADQYMLDAWRSYGIPAVVFRMSCIYGPRQFGHEDQGWVAHFLIRALAGDPVTIYGDGKQVRDVLFIGDLVHALVTAQQRMSRLSGQAFNIGGGPGHTISLLELVRVASEITGCHLDCEFAGWRPGDQRYYVSDVTKFHLATGWLPRVTPTQGIANLVRWLNGTTTAEFASEKAAS